MPKEKKEIENIELRSEEFQEILGHVPNWLTRWGTSIFFMVIVFLLIGSWLFKYPYVIPSPIIVTTENPPSHLMARASGKIEVLFVSDNSQVDPEDSIAIIENAADYKHIYILKNKIRIYKENNLNPDSFSLKFFNENLNLGEIQNSYNNFLKQFRDYKNFKILNFHIKKINSLNDELSKHKKYYEGLKRQQQILKKEYTLIGKQYQRDSSLYTNNVISEADLEKSESLLLQKKYAYEEANISLTSTKITISKINQNIMDLELDYSDKKNQYKLSLIEAYDNLEAQIALWEKQYVLKSPMKGIVTYSNYWSKNQNVNVGDIVVSVIPEHSGDIIGKINLQLQGAGKVKIGHQVNIKFKNYPFMEYGMVKGYIKTISLVPSKNKFYAVEVELPEGLRTFYNTELEFSQEMQGTAEIITENRRLIEEIIDPIKYIFKKNIDN